MLIVEKDVFFRAAVRLDFNPNNHSVKTEKPVGTGNPHGISILTELEILHT